MLQTDENSYSSITKKINVQSKKQEFGSDIHSKGDDAQTVCTSRNGVRPDINYRKDGSNSICKKTNQTTNSTTLNDTIIKLDNLPENEEYKSEVEGLESRIQTLEAELLSSINQNYLLRKEILLAKNVLKREVGGNAETFEELVKKMEEEGWMGREEIILSLQNKLHKLKNVLKQKSELAAMESKRYSSITSDDLSEDLKTYWRLELERETMLRYVHREVQFWVEERDRVKEKLEALMARNTELVEQGSTIRSDISMTSYDLSIITLSQLLEMERKMKSCLENKSKLLKIQGAEEIRTMQNKAIIENLKAEIVFLRITLKKSVENLTLFKPKDKKFQCLTSEIKVERLSNSRMFRKDLRKIIENYRRKLENLDFFSRAMEEAEQKSSEEFAQRPAYVSKGDGTCEMVQNTVDRAPHSETAVETRKTTILKSASSIENWKTRNKSESSGCSERPTELKSTGGILIEYLENEIVDLGKTFEAAERKIIEKSEHMKNVFDHMKTEVGQLLKQNNIFWKESANTKILMNKLRKLKKLRQHPTYESSSEDNFSCKEHPEVDDYKLLLQLLRNEHLFMINLIKTACMTTEDFDRCFQLCKNKDILLRIYQ